MSGRYGLRVRYWIRVMPTPLVWATVQVDVSAVGEDAFRAWEGWVHSRARTLVLGMQARFAQHQTLTSIPRFPGGYSSPSMLLKARASHLELVSIITHAEAVQRYACLSAMGGLSPCCWQRRAMHQMHVSTGSDC